MKAHLIDKHLVLRSRSSAKVKVNYQGHVSQKMGVSGALVFHKHVLCYSVFKSLTECFEFLIGMWLIKFLKDDKFNSVT